MMQRNKVGGTVMKQLRIEHGKLMRKRNEKRLVDWRGWRR